MIDLTVVNPTKDTFPIGTSLNQPCTVGIAGIHKDAGGGTVTAYTSLSFVASGTYDLLGQSGNWTVNLSSSDGALFDIAIILDGAGESYSRRFSAVGAMNGDTSIKMTGKDQPDLSIRFTQDDGSFFTEGRIVLDASWVNAQMFIHSGT